MPIKFKEKAKIIYETDKYGWKNRKYYPNGKLAFVHDKRPYNQMANYWKQAQILRDYITALENTEGLDIKRMDWIPWAKQKIEWFDPFTQGPDEILDDEDRDKLISELNETKPQTRNNYWYY